MRTQIILVLFSSFLVVSLAKGAENATYRFLRNDVGARAAALGGSFVSMTDDPASLFYNPSGISTLSKSQVGFGFFKHLLDINSGYAAYGQEIPGFGHVAAGINYINYGEFTRTDELANELGTFSANELAVSAAYAAPLVDAVRYGVGVKFIYSGIAEAASTAMALDFGALYILPEPSITVGIALLNVGTQLDPYYSTREMLPLDLKVGATVQPEHLPVLLNLNVHKLNETQGDFVGRLRAFSVGGEFLVSDAVRLRAGFNNERRRDMKVGTSMGLAGFSFGAGFIYEAYKFDYAFSSYGKIGELHRVSVGIGL